MEKFKQVLSNMNKKTKAIIASMLVVLLLLGAVALGFNGQHAAPNDDIHQPNDDSIVDIIDDDDDDVEEFDAATYLARIDHYDYAFLADLTNEQLMEMNADYSGWISINGTTINHPVVQGNDNVFYLKNTFEHTYTKYGAIYLDYRNKLDYSDKHIVIYGHHMLDGTMFRDVDKYKNSSYLNGRETIVLRTLKGTRTYRIFSVYTGTANNTKIVGPTFSKSLSYYIDRYKNRSRYPINVNTNNATQMLTLSSCNYDYNDGRVIVHAILVSVDEPNN